MWRFNRRGGRLQTLQSDFNRSIHDRCSNFSRRASTSCSILGAKPIDSIGARRVKWRIKAQCRCRAMGTGMEPIGPSPEAVQAFYRAQKQSAKALRTRIKEHPNKAKLSELIFAAGAIIIGTITIVLSLIWLAAIVWIWFQAMPEGIQIAGLLSAALLLGLFAYHAREILKSKTYHFKRWARSFSYNVYNGLPVYWLRRP